MTPPLTDSDRLLYLTNAVCAKAATDDELTELDAILRADAAARARYLEFCRLHVALGLEHQTQLAVRQAFEQIDSAPTSVPSLPLVTPLSPLPCPLSPAPSPLSNCFSSGWPAAYLIATVIFAVGLTVAAVTYVSHSSQQSHIAGGSSNPQSPIPNPSPVVARVTGMVDCVWDREGLGIRDWESEAAESGEWRVASGQWPVASGQNSAGRSSLPTIHYPLSTISPGDTLALKSGLLELTYDTGARVILQGPVTYRVDSVAGGYLSVGRLTAKLAKREEGRGERGEKAIIGSSSTSRRSLSTLHSPLSTDSNPSLSTTDHPLFTIKTPTAVITDLGTEFGIEVAKTGATHSLVFRGSVRVQALTRGGQVDGEGQVLCENESVRVDGTQSPPEIVAVPTAEMADFIRELPKKSIKVLDLVDVVAGGDGMGHCREQGIDPTTGKQETSFMPLVRQGGGEYRTVVWNPIVDGVFVPQGELGEATLDSAGHTFDGFPRTAGKTFGSIWGRAAEVQADVRTQDIQRWVYHIGAADEYMPNRRGLLGMHPNSGITFDLAAVRRTHVGACPVRFQAMAGMADDENSADLWVFVDGRLRLKKLGIEHKQGPVVVEVTLRPSDRFLTIASTSGKDFRQAWFVLGDPVLKMIHTANE